MKIDVEILERVKNTHLRDVETSKKGGFHLEGLCTDKEHCKFDIKGKNGEQPNITELEKMIKDIEI